MSMTFTIVGATYHKVAPFPDEPEFFVDEPDTGFYELNVSNTNAEAILKFLGEPRMAQEGFGQWKGKEVLKMLNKIRKYQRSAERAALVKPDKWLSRNFYEGGRDMSYIDDRLDRLALVFQSARDHKMDVMVS